MFCQRQPGEKKIFPDGSRVKKNFFLPMAAGEKILLPLAAGEKKNFADGSRVKIFFLPMAAE